MVCRYDDNNNRSQRRQNGHPVCVFVLLATPSSFIATELQTAGYSRRCWSTNLINTVSHYIYTLLNTGKRSSGSILFCQSESVRNHF